MDLFCLLPDKAALTVHPKWLTHLQERQLGEDGQVRRRQGPCLLAWQASGSTRPGHRIGFPVLLLLAMRLARPAAVRAAYCKFLGYTRAVQHFAGCRITQPASVEPSQQACGLPFYNLASPSPQPLPHSPCLPGQPPQSRKTEVANKNQSRSSFPNTSLNNLQVWTSG